jgi:phospholipid/cholesterol/gamma-HCH transport system substrate-binding protein
MKFSIRFADKIVGTLVILALAILIFVIFMLGSNQRWFARDYQYKTYFTSASGLSINMAIQYKGFTIGNVKKISLTENDEVEVQFTIFEEHRDRVRNGSLVEALISPIGLGNTFIFHPGRGEKLIPEGMLIPEVSSAEAKALIAAGLVTRPESTADDINAILSQVRLLIETVNIALSGSEGSAELDIGRIIGNLSDITSGFVPIVENLEKVMEQASAPLGTLMAILDGQGDFYSSLEQAIVSLAGIIESLDTTAEFLPTAVPQLTVLISQLNVTISSVQNLLTALENNPLLKGGVPERRESGPGGASPRDMEF